jgi:hypothetical protein
MYGMGGVGIEGARDTWLVSSGHALHSVLTDEGSPGPHADRSDGSIKKEEEIARIPA